MKRTYAAAFMVMALVTIGAFQNCAGKASFGTTEQQLASVAATSGDPVTIADPASPPGDPSLPVALPTAVPTPNSTPAPVAVCDPLSSSGSNACNTTSGLFGYIYYLSGSQINTYSNGVNNYILYGTKLPTPLILSNFNVPVRDFTAGFSVAGGDPLKKTDGSVLVEYFAFDLAGYLTLSSSYPSGYYQFQTNSDDGSNLYLNGAIVVDNDGTHSMASAVSKPVLLATDAAVAIHIQYYQGPKQQIGLQVYMRKCGGSDVSTCSASWEILPSSILTY